MPRPRDNSTSRTGSPFACEIKRRRRRRFNGLISRFERKHAVSRARGVLPRSLLRSTGRGREDSIGRKKRKSFSSEGGGRFGSFVRRAIYSNIQKHLRGNGFPFSNKISVRMPLYASSVENRPRLLSPSPQTPLFATPLFANKRQKRRGKEASLNGFLSATKPSNTADK